MEDVIMKTKYISQNFSESNMQAFTTIKISVRNLNDEEINELTYVTTFDLGYNLITCNSQVISSCQRSIKYAHINDLYAYSKNGFTNSDILIASIQSLIGGMMIREQPCVIENCVYSILSGMSDYLNSDPQFTDFLIDFSDFMHSSLRKEIE